MAMKKVCDGCDAPEPEPDAFFRVTVDISDGGDSDYDLCTFCVEKFNSVANPKKWPRGKRPRKPRAQA